MHPVAASLTSSSKLFENFIFEDKDPNIKLSNFS